MTPPLDDSSVAVGAMVGVCVAVAVGVDVGVGVGVSIAPLTLPVGGRRSAINPANAFCV